MKAYTRLSRLAVILQAVLLAACSEAAPGPLPVVARVVIDPHAPDLTVGATLLLRATALDASEKEITGLTVTWASLSPDVAAISAQGVLEAKAAGTAEIRATAQAKSAATTIVVSAPGPGPIARLAITPAIVSLEEGSERALAVTAYDAADQPLPGPVVATWMSNNEDVAPVTQTGVVTALVPGTATVSAFYAGHTATAPVDVQAHWGFDLVFDELTATHPALFALDLRDPVAEPALILPAGAAASDPTPSPDGTRIAFVVTGATSTAIYVADRAGAGATRLTADQGFARQPTWSPDGSQLAFHFRAASGATSDIWVIDAGGGNAVNLTEDFGAESEERDPAWSRAGPTGSSRIAFVRVLNGTSHIWSMRFDGTGKRRVTDTQARDLAPAWSPDGMQLAFLRDSKLWVVSAAGLDPRPLVQLGGSQASPAWSPDGKLIAFLSSHESPSMLYTIWADGSKLARRRGGYDYLGQLAWRVRPN